ncbi:MAG: hypothetical protein PWQ75_260 [Methanolobus sp.]|uniref:PAS domain S-box protein n=1 Tax=Methanolobus sp. TaxID=1874737 RepID=UPI00258531B7|nr:PAS domain S-box protein [Methanolobus sp.]MDK2830508.1 hypothetical protein [Methanolobus sp.]
MTDSNDKGTNNSSIPNCSNEDFKNLVDELPLGILSCDTKGNITSVNDFLLEILGSPSAKATMKINILNFPPLAESGISAIVEEAIRTGRNTSIETTYRSKWNKELFLSFRAFPRKDANGNVNGCHAIIEDLTTEKDTSSEIEYDRRKDELISKISNRLVTSNFEDIDKNINRTLKDIGIFIGAERVVLFIALDEADQIVKTHEWYIDGIISKIPLHDKIDAKKLVPDKLRNLEIISVSDIDDIPKKQDLLQHTFRGLGIKALALIPLSRYGIFKGFLGMDSKSKAHVWKEKELYLLKIAGDMLINILERKKTEELLHEKEKDYEDIIYSLDTVIWKTTFDSEGNSINSYISQSLATLAGFESGSIGNDWNSYFEHIHKDDLPRVQEGIKKAFMNPDIPISIDYRMISNGGSTIWMNSLGSAQPLGNGNYLLSGTTSNITERKLAEEKLRENEELLSEVSRLGKIGGWKIDIESGKATLTDEILEIYEDDNVGGIENGLKRFTPGSRKILKKAINNAIEKHESYDHEVELFTPNGTLKWVRTIGYPVIEDGRTVKLQGTLQDITDRKEAELKLKESEALLSEVSRIGKIGGWEYDVKTNIGNWTSEIYKIHEIEPGSYVSVEESLKYYTPDSRKVIEKAFNDAINEAKPYDLELELITPNGTHKWIRTSCIPTLRDGKVVKITGSYQDITTRKNTENKLIASSNLLSEVSRMGKIGGWELDLRTNKATWTSELFTIHETDQVDSLEKAMNRYSPKYRERLKNAMEDAINKYEPYDIELEFTSESGKQKWIRSIGKPVIENNKVVKLYGTLQDITELKEAENKLIENEELMRLFIEHAPASLAMFDKDMNYISVSNRWLSDLGLEKDIIGMCHYDVIPERNDEIKDLHQRALQGEIIVREEDYFKPPNGGGHWVHWEARPWKTVDDNIGGIVVFAENITQRKEAEEEIKRNEEKYRALFEQSNDAILLLRYGGIIQELNSKALEVFECTEEDLYGISVIDLVPPEMKDKALEYLKLFRKGELNKFTFKAVTFKKNVLDVEVSAKVLEGQEDVSQLVIRDITARKKAVEKLKRNEEKYRALFEQSNDAIFLNHIDGTIVDVNEKACEIFGYTRDELKAKNVVDLLAPEHSDIGSEGMDNFRETGVASLYTQYQKANGEIFDAEVNAKIIEGENDLAQGIIRDISERKKAEEEIIRSEMKYRALFEKSNDAVLIHDLTGRILDINDKACTMFGYSKKDMMKINIIKLMHPDDIENTVAAMEKIKENKSWRNETRMIRADGSILHLDVSGSLIEAQGNIIQAVGRDITERIKAEEEKMQATIEAETASRSKSDFLATMSHELRTPLNSIIGFSDIILDGMAGNLEDKQEHYLQHISQSGRHLLNLINDILDISKIEAGKMELYPEIVDIRTSVSEIVTMTESLASRKNITVDIDMPDDMPLISADKSKIKQIMYNILGNAIKFTDNGGNVHIKLSSDDENVTMSITDTGIGISPEDQNKLFKPFSQIDTSISRSFEGTGLGLALVKELIELHGGRIWVESEAGKGSTFSFKLPIKTDE